MKYSNMRPFILRLQNYFRDKSITVTKPELEICDRCKLSDTILEANYLYKIEVYMSYLHAHSFNRRRYSSYSAEL